MAFNKMFVMIPVMLAARKIDNDDPTVILYLRMAYFVVQIFCFSVCVFTYLKAQAAASKAGNTNKTIYVAPPPQPFADPNAKKQYKMVVFGAHVISQSRSLLGTTLFGICMTVGLHWYKGMVMGLAIQTIMGPFNLAENALVKAIFMGGGISLEGKIFGEKAPDELTDEDEVVDEAGKVVVRKANKHNKKIKGASNGTTDTNSKKTFEEVLLDTWDEGNKADIGPLMELITKNNCNHQVKESGWTVLMILSGLGAKGTSSAIKQVMALGGNPATVDGEGWNAMHWAAFHGSAEAAKVLKEESALLSVQDKDGKSPLELAQAEGNKDVAKILEAVVKATSKKGNASSGDQDGLRKRK